MRRRLLVLLAVLALQACGGQPEQERSAPSWGALSGPTPIARLDGEAILLDDVGPELGLQVYQHQLDTYALLKRETERLVGERLLAREAERQKLGVDALIQRELDASGGTPSDGEVNRYLEEHPDAARWPEARARVALYLAETRRLERRAALVARLRNNAKFEFLVEPPVEPRVRLDLTDVPVRGPDNARVTLVHFASFASPLSAHSAAQLARLATEFPDRLRFAHRTFLSEPDEMALAAAELAVAAQQAGSSGTRTTVSSPRRARSPRRSWTTSPRTSRSSGRRWAPTAPRASASGATRTRERGRASSRSRPCSRTAAISAARCPMRSSGGRSSRSSAGTPSADAARDVRLAIGRRGA